MCTNVRLSILAALLAFAGVATARADMRAPGPQPPNETVTFPVVLKIDEEARDIRLQIPEQFLNDAEPVAGNGPSQSRTLFAGLAMSVAVGSLFFVKRGNRVVRRAVVSAVGLVALLTASGIVQADMRGPFHNSIRHQRLRRPENLADVLLPAGTTVTSDVIFEILPVGDAITIILPSQLKSKTALPAARPFYPAPAAPEPAPAPPAPTPAPA